MARLWAVSALLLASAAFACSSDSSVTPPPPQYAVVRIVSGDAQKGTVDSDLPAPLVVSVTTETGTPIPNAKVNWGVEAGEGRLSSSASVTDRAGKASVTWTLGPSPNVNQVVKAWTDIEGSQSVEFSATGEAKVVPPPPPVSSISVWPDTNVVFTGMTRTLSLSVFPASASASEPATWSTSDASVVTIENGVVTAVGSGHATITALLEGHASQPIEVFVLPAPSPPLRFSTVSETCGLTTDGLLYCWGSPFPGMPGPFDRCRDTIMFITKFYRCSEIPRLVSADLRFKALAGIVSGGCAVTVDGGIYCWGGNTQGELGLGFKDNETRGLTRVPTNGEFLEVGGGGTRCARRIDEVILCWGSNDRGDAGIGSLDASYSSAVVTPTPINTSVRFRKLSSGGNCGLATDSTAYCWGSFVGDDSARAGCNTGCSLSPIQVKAEKLVDLGTNHSYCGIGVSGRAYCWGFHGYNPYRYAEPHEIPNPGFRSFDRALYTVDGSGAAFEIEDYGALWRFYPLPTVELRYKKYFGDCGIALDDKLYCGTRYTPYGKVLPGQ